MSLTLRPTRLPRGPEMARRNGERVRLLIRNGNDWSERVPAIVAAVEGLDIGSWLIDGEVAHERGLTKNPAAELTVCVSRPVKSPWSSTRTRNNSQVLN